MLAQAEAAFAEDFAGRVLPFDEERCASVSGKSQSAVVSKAGPIADFDAQVAAIAHSRGAILAKHAIPKISKAAAFAW